MLKNIISDLRGLNEADLRTLNSAVVDQLKLLRNRDAAVNRRLFVAGDRVSWSGRRGYAEGTIVRVKRKKAIVDVSDSGKAGLLWDVPLGMLRPNAGGARAKALAAIDEQAKLAASSRLEFDDEQAMADCHG